MNVNKVYNVLNVYVIHSDKLNNRIKYINSTLELIKNVSEKNNLSLNVKIISEPNADYISKNIDVFNKRTSLEKDGNAHFNNLIKILNVHQISNIESHRNIYDYIHNEDELHFVIEDDVVINQQYIDNIETFFANMRNNSFPEWDILFTCTASTNENSMQLVSSRIPFKVLLSKSSYFIKPSLAKKLIEHFKTLKFTFKIGLSKYIDENDDVKSYVLNKHTFMEGSKIGIFTSSINTSTNFLYQNINYVTMAKMSSLETISSEHIANAEVLFERIKDMNNPDIYHTMAILYYKNKNYAKAKELMIEACGFIESEHGIVSKSTDILNNAINMFQYDQANLEEYKKKKSKYGGL